MKRFNLVDAALLLLFLGIVGALGVQLFMRNPLRKAVLDDAPRSPVEVEVASDSLFLTGLMTPGDAQRYPGGDPGIELLSFEVERNQLVARFKVQARQWRDFRQYGEMTLLPGERFEFVTPKYKLIGIIRHVRP